MSSRSTASLATRLLVTFVSATIALPASISLAFAQSGNGQQQVGTNNQPQSGAAKLTEAQLAALVAPIALYPDPLVSQVLMASTYPLEIAEAYNWQRSNSRLSGSALNQALQQQNWDPSVKSLVSFAPVLGMMGTQLSWTQNLGNAVLAQQSDVMTAIQDLRAKAKATGALQSNTQQTVTTQGSGSGETIIIQPANPQVVYVPTYNPSLVYGTWGYPAYPPYSYYPPGYVAGTALLSFGVGMAVGAALWGGCNWGGGGGWNHWGGGWGGGNSLTVNNNTFNNFNHGTNSNWTGGNRTGSSNWQPNMQRVNSSLGGGANDALRNQQRDQLRQNMQRDGFSGGERGGLGGADRGGFGGAERGGAERGGLSGDRSSGGGKFGSDQRFGGGDRSGGQRDPGGFGSHHSSFGGGDHFGGGGSHFGGGGSHFGGGRR